MSTGYPINCTGPSDDRLVPDRPDPVTSAPRMLAGARSSTSAYGMDRRAAYTYGTSNPALRPVIVPARFRDS